MAESLDAKRLNRVINALRLATNYQKHLEALDAARGVVVSDPLSPLLETALMDAVALHRNWGQGSLELEV